MTPTNRLRDVPGDSAEAASVGFARTLFPCFHAGFSKRRATALPDEPPTPGPGQLAAPIRYRSGMTVAYPPRCAEMGRWVNALGERVVSGGVVARSRVGVGAGQIGGTQDVAAHDRLLQP